MSSMRGPVVGKKPQSVKHSHAPQEVPLRSPIFQRDGDAAYWLDFTPHQNGHQLPYAASPICHTLAGGRRYCGQNPKLTRSLLHRVHCEVSPLHQRERRRCNSARIKLHQGHSISARRLRRSCIPPARKRTVNRQTLYWTLLAIFATRRPLYAITHRYIMTADLTRWTTPRRLAQIDSLGTTVRHRLDRAILRHDTFER